MSKYQKEFDKFKNLEKNKTSSLKTWFKFPLIKFFSMINRSQLNYPLKLYSKLHFNLI